MSYNDLSGCACCEGNSFPCQLVPVVECDGSGETTPRNVPCLFKVNNWPTICGESVTYLCMLGCAATGEHAHKLYAYSSFNAYLNFWEDVDHEGGECSDPFGERGPMGYEATGGILYLSPAVQGDNTIDWVLTLRHAAGAVMATWKLEDWDPFVSGENGLFLLDSVAAEIGRYQCPTDCAPDWDTSLESSVPSTVTLTPLCFNSYSGTGYGDSPTDCFTDSADASTCDANTSPVQYAFATGVCQWNCNASSEWVADNSGCITGDCGPPPTCSCTEGDAWITGCYTCPAPAAMMPMLAEGSNTEPVPLTRKVANLGQQVLKSGKQLLDGGPLLASPEQRAERLAICNGCPHSDYGASATCKDLVQADGSVLKGCGCTLVAAIATAAKSCPQEKW